MQDLRRILDDEFHKLQFTTILENLTDDHLILKIKGGMSKQTVLEVTRNRNRPLELELLVDYSLTKQSDLVRKTKPRSSNQGRGMFGSYRLIWIFLILGSFILSILNSFFGGFARLIENLTPGLTPFERGMATLGVIVVTIIIWFTVVPKIRARNRSQAKKFDFLVLGIVKDIIEILNDKMGASEIKRCWNCFEVVTVDTEFCENCGKQQQ